MLSFEIKEITKEIPDFKECVALARKRLAEEKGNYGTYEEHIFLYENFKEQLRDGEFFQEKPKNALEKYVKKHVMHCLALKLARISASPWHTDSYVDVIGYVTLYMNNMDLCMLPNFSRIYGVPNADKINQFLTFVNDYIFALVKEQEEEDANTTKGR